MVVKKATSAASRGVPPKKATPKKATPGKAASTNAVAKAKPAKGPTKVAQKPAKKAAPAKPAAKAAGKTPEMEGAAKATGAKAAATKAKVPPTKVTAKAAATKAKVPPTKVTAKAAAAGVTARTAGSRGRGAAAGPSAGDLPQRLRVRENERPWTVKELATVRADLEADIVRLQSEISVAEHDLAGLMRDVSDGAGDDPADAGTATFEREQEISLANNAREVFAQSARALARLIDGSYGICESCGNPIGKNRLLAFPRATLCMTCKSKQERR